MSLLKHLLLLLLPLAPALGIMTALLGLPATGQRLVSRLVLVIITLALGWLSWLMLSGGLESVDLSGAISPLFRFAWSLEPQLLFPLWMFVLLAWTSLAMPSDNEPVLTLGMLTGTILFCVSNDTTTLLTGWGLTILALWLALARTSGLQSSAIASLCLRWQLTGWMGGLLTLAALAGALALVRSAPHAAPSETGFLLKHDLLHISRVTAQHPAALELWNQIGGWILLPAVIGALAAGGVFPFHGWLRQVSAAANPHEQLWIHVVLTKLPLLFLLRVVLPVYANSPQLVLFAVATPAVLGMVMVAAEFASQPVTAESWRSRPLVWGSQFAFLIAAVGVLNPAQALQTAVVLLGVASSLWVLTTQTSKARTVAPSWMAALTFCAIPVAAGRGSLLFLAQTWPVTETPFDFLVWCGVCAAVGTFTIRLLPTLIQRSPVAAAENLALVDNKNRFWSRTWACAWRAVWIAIVIHTLWQRPLVVQPTVSLVPTANSTLGVH